LETIPGVGFIAATAIAATVTDPSHFKSGREFSAWLGLTPGKIRRVERTVLAACRRWERLFAFSHRRRSHGDDPLAREKGAVSARWINALLEKKPTCLVSVAVANKTARIAWALLVRKEAYSGSGARLLHERSASDSPEDRKVLQLGRVIMA